MQIPGQALAEKYLITGLAGQLDRFPPGVDPRSKYWPPVRRIDGAYGDRNLVCSCPPAEAYA